MNYIRKGKGRLAVGLIKGQGHVKRALGEHKEYANWSDRDIETYVDLLNLEAKQKEIVIKKMIGDRNHHSKESGEFH